MNSARVVVKSLQVALGLAVLVLIVVWMSGGFKDKIEPTHRVSTQPNDPESGETAVVEEQTTPVIEVASGTVEARRKTLVSSRILASIRELKVRAGDRIAQGETLVLLDDRDLAARVQQAQRAVDAAQAAFAKAEADFSRASELLSRGVVGRSEFEQAESASKIAAAQLESAKKAQQEAEVSSSFAAITAPVSGVVVERYAEPGDTASPGQPLLALYDPQSLRIEAPVRESLLKNIQVGDTLDVRLGDTPTVIEGRVGEIVPQAEAGSRTFLVKVDLPASEGIYTGIFARILIPVGQRKRTLIPLKAVERIGQLSFVNVPGEGRRLITLGSPTAPETVEVLSGLKAGEKVSIPPAL